VPLTTPELVLAADKGIDISGDVDLFSHEISAPVVGITGSNGKSTVTMLLRKMAADAGLTALAGGNIGVPVLELLEQEDGIDTDVNEKKLYVLELSSFQLETLNQLTMKAAVVLNISEDHLDRYDNLTSYAVSKHSIYNNAQWHIVNLDDNLAVPVQGDGSYVIGFTLSTPKQGQFGISRIKDKDCVCYGEQALVSVDDIKLKGAHNLQNVLAALSLGKAVGLCFDDMVETLKCFTGLPHRTQWVAEADGVNWVNDSKATNTGAAIAAISGMNGPLVVIAGGESKGADFSEFSDQLKLHCRAVILLGRDADLLDASIQQSEITPTFGFVVKHVNDMSSAVKVANDLALQGDTVVLAPACASLDMFDSFEHRGDVFMRLV